MTVFTMLCMRHAVRLFGIVDHDVGDGDGDDADDSGACCVVAAGVISVIGSTVTTISDTCSVLNCAKRRLRRRPRCCVCGMQ